MREQKQATPASIYVSWSGKPTSLMIIGLSEGTSIQSTKFVECPVVESMPKRLRILYTGQR